eukprot:scaffold7542_cov124-Isochrysis_galbana.AAC.2
MDPLPVNLAPGDFVRERHFARGALARDLFQEFGGVQYWGEKEEKRILTRRVLLFEKQLGKKRLWLSVSGLAGWSKKIYKAAYSQNRPTS